MIYFDQAASSFPKPEGVVRAVSQALTEYGANPGRGGHRLARNAASVIKETRIDLADFFGLSHPENVLFFSNATGALNQALLGFPLQTGDHVIATCYEHNSVRRPLEFLRKTKGIEVTYILPEQMNLESVIRRETQLLVAIHGSNLTGLIVPIEKLAEASSKYQIPFLVDASQTAGILPIHMEEIGIDMLAFPGHKGLLGPQGTGALMIKEGIRLTPLIHGGTGAHSENPEQPEDLPFRYESGTLNTPGIAGLRAGLEEVKRLGLQHIFQHELKLAESCIHGLEEIDGVEVYGPRPEEKRLGVVSFRIQGVDVQETAMVLDQHYDIAVRAGLHCTPLAHEAMGTIEEGTVRVSFGPYNTLEEVKQFIEAIREIKIGLGE